MKHCITDGSQKGKHVEHTSSETVEDLSKQYEKIVPGLKRELNFLKEKKMMDKLELLDADKNIDSILGRHKEYKTQCDEYEGLLREHTKLKSTLALRESEIKMIQFRIEYNEVLAESLLVKYPEGKKGVLESEGKDLEVQLSLKEESAENLKRQIEKCESQLKDSESRLANIKDKLENKLAGIKSVVKKCADIREGSKQTESRINKVTKDIQEWDKKYFDVWEDKGEGRLLTSEIVEAYGNFTKLDLEEQGINQQIDELVEAECSANNVTNKLCPRCNAGYPKARKGKFGAFIGCSNFEKSGCRWTLKPQRSVQTRLFDLLTKRDQIDACSKGEKGAIENQKKAQQVKIQDINRVDENSQSCYLLSPRNLKKGVFWFRSLAIPRALLKEKEKYSRVLADYNKFILTYNEQRKEQVDSKLRTIYSLALRVINRGEILGNTLTQDKMLREHFNQKDIGKLDDMIRCVKNEHPSLFYDSPREKKFAEKGLSKVLGPYWSLYTMTQVGFYLLTPNEAEKFVDQRVDFLIDYHGNKLVIELDGPEHSKRALGDKQRDKVLTENGYKVKRYTNAEVDNDLDTIVTELRGLLKVDEVTESPYPVEWDSNYLIASKLLHQFVIAIIKGLEQGYINLNTKLSVDGQDSVLEKEDLEYILALAIEEVRDLLLNYAAIYSIQLVPSFEGSEEDEFTIVLGGGNQASQCSCHLEDKVLSFDFLCNIEPLEPIIKPTKVARKYVEYFLWYIFGFEQLRDGQYDAIKRLLLGQDSIILLPTGAGKSIIYQLSSYILPGMVVIISPLRSLMDDQVYNLKYVHGITNAMAIMGARGIEAEEQKARTQRLGSPMISLLYIAPERLQIPSFRNAVGQILSKSCVYTIAIDEAHCVSEWGHDFRPAYLNIANFSRQLFKKEEFLPTVFALTGTASEHVLKDVARSLNIKDKSAIILPSTYDRKELHFRVVRTKVNNKMVAIGDIISNRLPEEFGEKFSEFSKMDGASTKGGIIFNPNASSSKFFNIYAADSVYHYFRNMYPQMGIAPYYSKCPEGIAVEVWEKSLRNTAECFKKNSLNLLMATKAFGMGIDKSNIRYIIHNGIPSSLEAYYQEAGRAGRGRDDSYCYIVFSNDFYGMYEPVVNAESCNVEEARKQYGKGTRETRDDLSAVLFFHFSSFGGLQEEESKIHEILGKLEGQKWQENSKIDVYGKLEDKELKKVLKGIIRLIVIGVIKDYTYDYNSSLTVECGSLDRKDITRRFVEYIREDNEQRAKAVEKKIRDVPGEGFAFVKAVIREFLEYVYDNIERSRRIAIRTMYTTVKDIVELSPEEQDKRMRKAVESYFSVRRKEGSNINSLQEADNAGIKLIRPLLGQSVLKTHMTEALVDKYRDLAYQASRLLEGTPDQPSLTMVYALCTWYANDEKKDEFISNFLLAIKFFRDRYSVDDNVLYSELAMLMHDINTRDPQVFNELVCKIGEKFDGVQSSILRSIMEHWSIEDLPKDVVYTYMWSRMSKTGEVL